MDIESAINELEAFWEPDNGVFWQLRHGNFNEGEVGRFISWLERFKFEDDTALPRRLVSLLWYVPLFMQWQSDRIQEAGGDAMAYSQAITAVRNELERILGVP